MKVRYSTGLKVVAYPSGKSCFDMFHHPENAVQTSPSRYKGDLHCFSVELHIIIIIGLAFVGLVVVVGGVG